MLYVHMSKFAVYLPYEVNVLEDLKTAFGDRFIHNDRYSTYDFTTNNEEVYIEVKNLECHHLKYEYVPIGFNKIAYALEMLQECDAKRFIFIYNYINDNIRLFYEFHKKDLKRFRVSSLKLTGHSPKPHFWVPRNEFKEMHLLTI